MQAFGKIISEWWHPDQTALVCADSTDSLYGLDARQVRAVSNRAAGVITIALPGNRRPHPLVEGVRPRIFIDTDPGYTQMWASMGDAADIFGQHDFYFTVGCNIGTPHCTVPTAGIEWRGIWNPVITDWWSAPSGVNRGCFTTIAAWWGQGYFEFDGKVWGPKAEEFRHFIALPRLLGEEIELTLEINPDDPDLDILRRYGWRIEDPRGVASPERYRDYVLGSLGEFTCAKGGYVGTRCGWFSDRSACYLAAGRPVVLQATGFANLLPTGKGLFSVATPEEAVEAIREIKKDYQTHSAAARAIAKTFFDSDVVCRRLLAEAGITGERDG